jgi:nucleoside-diphosphate kinase
MKRQRTLCIIKPDACESRRQGVILQRLLDEGFELLGMKQIRLTLPQAEGFYAVHADRPFFQALCGFMTRNKVVVLALSREDAVVHLRTVIGATDPTKANAGTVRKLFGSSVTENAVHASDSEENGRIECAYFFAEIELR